MAAPFSTGGRESTREPPTGAGLVPHPPPRETASAVYAHPRAQETPPVAVRRQCRRPSGTHSADGGTSARVAAHSDVAALAANGGDPAAPGIATGSGDTAPVSYAGNGGAEAVADPPRSPAAPPEVFLFPPPKIRQSVRRCARGVAGARWRDLRRRRRGGNGRGVQQPGGGGGRGGQRRPITSPPLT